MSTIDAAADPIGFIGLGVMGKGMARNLLKAGFALVVHNRSSASVDELARDGAVAAASPADVARRCRRIMLCLPDTPDVERVLFGPEGVAGTLERGSVIIDTSTISATATRDFAGRLAAKGVELIDSPVSGGPKGAADGTLSCMIGGDAAVIEACRPLLEAIGTKHVHLGPTGAGQLVKSCNQLVIAATLLGVSEAIALCRGAGLDPALMREALLAGSAQSFVLQNHAKRIIDETLAPGFRSTLMLKDLKLALSAGQDLGTFMPGTALAVQLFNALVASGRSNLDSAALGLLVGSLSAGMDQPPS